MSGCRWCIVPIENQWRYAQSLLMDSSSKPSSASDRRMWFSGQRFERGVCTAPRRVEVAAIKRDQRARRFEDRVGLVRQRLTAGVRKSRSQSANRFQLTDQYSGRRRGGLTNLIERELGEALSPH